MAWEIFPEPGWMFFGANATGELGFFKEKPVLSPSPHPIALYLKAHVINQKVEAVSVRPDGALEILFRVSGTKIILSPERGWLQVSCEVAGRKPFRQRVPITRIPVVKRETLVEGTEKPAAEGIAPKSADEKKRERLLANIRGDLGAADEWMKLWSPLCAQLESDPTLWGRPDELSEEIRTLVVQEIGAGELPPWGAQNTGRALEKLFQSRRKAIRRQKGAELRLKKVESQGPVLRASLGVSTSQKLEKKELTAEERSRIAPKTKPGVWVELSPGLWARVGRSVSENDELFRQARDRDLWFHVRGGPGGHIWVPRGQVSFGAKAEPSMELIRLGCQLALINSPASKSGSAVVDYTERRSLRKIRSTPGAVEILRSETRHTRLDEEFEKKILKRGG